VNLKGPFRLGVLAGTRMAEADGGSIINISSIGSLRPGPDELIYACAKADLNALTVGLADAFGPRVRLGYGRLRHGTWSIAKAQWALDMAAQYALDRETSGLPLADRQGVQWMLADCARDLYITRLMVLHIAYKMEHGLDISQENSIAKN
jgi:NAD(P)-dependent dehydrogenase (short-subunit alcohol dehydrogenase family)